MHTANEWVFTVSKTASEVKDAEAWIKELNNENTNGEIQKEDALIEMGSLNIFQLLNEVGFFLHKTGLLFWTMLLHFSSDLLKMLFAENILLFEKVFHFFSCC